MDVEQLIVHRGRSVVQTLPLAPGIVSIGRLPDNGLVLADGEVSRHQAEVRCEPTGTTITDLGSANGTFVGGEQLSPNVPRLLLAGDVIKIGPFSITYEAPEEEHTVLDLPPMAAVAPSEPKPVPPVESAPVAAEPEAEVAVEPPVAEPAAPEVPPPPPPIELKPPEPPRPTWPLPPADGPASRYLRYLPGLYQDNDFLGRFLLIMESIWEPLETREDFIEAYFDPRTCPPDFLHWIAGWLGLALDAHWPESRKRRLLAEAMELYRWRGTRYGLARMIEICTGLVPEVTELPAGKQPFAFRVRLAVPPDSGIDRDLVETLVRAHKPAHAAYVLELS